MKVSPNIELNLSSEMRAKFHYGKYIYVSSIFAGRVTR